MMMSNADARHSTKFDWLKNNAKPIEFHVKINFHHSHPRADFQFFHRRGGKILGEVQVICNMPFLMLWKAHEMANQSAPRG